MKTAFIEIEKDETFKGKGNINLIPKGEYWAILYSKKEGTFKTIFKVVTSEENIEKVKNSHPNVKVYYTLEEMQIRGLELKPGTLLPDEIDQFYNKIKKAIGLDLKKEKESKTKKTWYDYLHENAMNIPRDEDDRKTIFDITNWI